MGHSYVLSQIILLVQECMFEHKHGLQVKQLCTLIKKKHISIYVQPKISSNYQKSINLINFLHMTIHASLLSLLELPLLGSNPTKSMGGISPYRLTKSIGLSYIYGYHTGTMASGFTLFNPPRFHFIISSGHIHVSKIPMFMQTCPLFQPFFFHAL